MDGTDGRKFLGTKDEALLPGRFVYGPAEKDPGRYGDDVRRFQGIPGVERTKGGRRTF